MTSVLEKTIDPKLGLLELVGQASSVSQTYEVMGYRREIFYPVQGAPNAQIVLCQGSEV
ncbi:hypothetical protein [Ruegeria atlantica]|uniref:hypothetical protein n=1 Tax=Ruegeria atlantica TaxID=81569 RepID=UPI00249450B0|nr:hypothetical protein [Ruegeria atlantica]